MQYTVHIKILLYFKKKLWRLPASVYKGMSVERDSILLPVVPLGQVTKGNFLHSAHTQKITQCNPSLHYSKVKD